ncbi:MAG: hypothetical protein MJD61_13660 [Proteobacteria bacterium]|nr:hypothetical protein [Pseudomonadota bacterium]
MKNIAGVPGSLQETRMARVVETPHGERAFLTRPVRRPLGHRSAAGLARRIPPCLGVLCGIVVAGLVACASDRLAAAAAPGGRPSGSTHGAGGTGARATAGVLSGAAGATPGAGGIAGGTSGGLAGAGAGGTGAGMAGVPGSVGGGIAGSSAAPATGCNGMAALCARRYDAAAYATTHNAMASMADGFLAPNQHHGIKRQLEDGIRALMLDLHYDETGQAALCHGSCAFGKRDLRSALGEITGFVDTHPREVLTLILESYVKASDFEVALRDAGLLGQLVEHAPGTAWPTLGALIDANTRLVVLADREGGAFPGYLEMWSEAWEVPFEARTVADFSCSPGRGKPSNPLFVFNHFLTAPLASPELAQMVNHDPLLSDRLAECQRASGDLPNFVSVDFYNIGDVLAATARLNSTP